MRYDANTHEHDHFMCSSCGILRDADVAQSVQRLLEQQIMDCHVSGRLTISGICKNCKGKTL
jgi:Fe2+ or Zn2+ uptake regulation protein